MHIHNKYKVDLGKFYLNLPLLLKYCYWVLHFFMDNEFMQSVGYFSTENVERHA